MDWAIFSTAFLTSLVAEMGDKTQLASMALSSRTASTGSVLLGSILGLSLATLLGIVVGRWLGTSLSPVIMKWASGLLFMVVGLSILVSKPS